MLTVNENSWLCHWRYGRRVEARPHPIYRSTPCPRLQQCRP